MKVGRPQIVTNDVLRKLEYAYLIGCNDIEACSYALIGLSTLYDYQKTHPEFIELKRGWKLNPFLKAKFTIYYALDKPKYAKWYLETHLPEEYSLRRKKRQQMPPINFKIEYILNSLERK